MNMHIIQFILIHFVPSVNHVISHPFTAVNIISYITIITGKWTNKIGVLDVVFQNNHLSRVYHLKSHFVNTTKQYSGFFHSYYTIK